MSQDREVEYYECIVGPNGESDAKYTWTLNKSPKPRRSRAIAHRMAQTPEENLERLKFAGEVMNETKSFCYSCKRKYLNIYWEETLCDADSERDCRKGP